MRIYIDSEQFTMEINCKSQEPGIACKSFATYFQQGPKIIMTTKINIQRKHIKDAKKSIKMGVYVTRNNSSIPRK